MPNVPASITGFSGEIVGPGHPDYEKARECHDRRIDRRPAAILRCRTSADVQAALRFARDKDLEIAVRSGGHSVPGYCVVDGGVVIDLRALQQMDADIPARRLRVGPGCKAGEIAQRLQPHNLAAVAGFDPKPGYVGLAIHGGRGALGCRYGWGSDQVLGAKLVTADGEAITVSETEHPDLLFGLRGAGSNFGIVTELEAVVQPIPNTVLAGSLMYGPAEVSKVLPRLIALFDSELAGSVEMVFTLFADHGGVYLRIMLVHAGEEAQARSQIASIRAQGKALSDSIAPVAYSTMLNDGQLDTENRFVWAEQGTHLAGEALTSALLAVADEVAASTKPGQPGRFIISWPFGSGYMRPQSLPTPVPRRSGWDIAFYGGWTDPAYDAFMSGWALSTTKRLQEQGIGDGVPTLNLNTVTGPEGVRRAYGDEAYARLQQLKRTYDPGNVFHLNHNVEPT